MIERDDPWFSGQITDRTIALRALLVDRIAGMSAERWQYTLRVIQAIRQRLEEASQ